MMTTSKDKALLTGELKSGAEALCARYPDRESALIPILHLVQAEAGWISDAAVEEIADYLNLSPAHVDGVATFYTMFFRNPVGRHIIQVCRTLSCHLRNSEGIAGHLTERLGIGPGETTADRRFSLVEVECIGACGTAPAMMIGDDLYENLTVEQLDSILDALE